LGGRASPFYSPVVEAPDYVLYDEAGTVVVSTVRQPPTATRQLRAASARGKGLDVNAGGDRYHALPLAEGDRLHLLLLPAPSIVDALGDTVRLILLGLIVLSALALGTTLKGRGGLTALLDVVRGSFSRKLLASVLVARSSRSSCSRSSFAPTSSARRGEPLRLRGGGRRRGTARRRDYQSVGEDDPTIPRLRLNDQALWWLRRVVGQEIHVYENGVLAATSKPELFDSALLQKRLPGEVDRDIVRGGQPFVVRRERLGARSLPVAYARVDEPGGPRDAVIAVPLVIEQRAFSRSVDRWLRCCSC
jgi:hypothetical protein